MHLLGGDDKRLPDEVIAFNREAVKEPQIGECDVVIDESLEMFKGVVRKKMLGMVDAVVALRLPFTIL